MDTLTTIVLAVILLAVAVPAIEIAVKRPGIFLDLCEGPRAFAEAGLRKSVPMKAAAEGREVPANDSKAEGPHSDRDRLAA